MNAEYYIPLNAGRARSLAIWTAARRRLRRRRIICWILGHQWSHTTLTIEVWPQHHGYYVAHCSRCMHRGRP